MVVNNEDNEDEIPPIPHIVTAVEMLREGLLLLIEEKVIIRRSINSQMKTFIDNFGMKPTTACMVYEDLQVKHLNSNPTLGSELDLQWFLRSVFYLRNYPKEHQLESIFGLNEKYASRYCWEWISRIQGLASQKIKLPENHVDTFVMSLDGTDSWTQERQHPTFNRDEARFSKKFDHAGLSYLLGISLTGGLICMYGPFKAGTNDIKKYRQCGLKDWLTSLKKRAIGDLGFRGEPATISIQNVHDSGAVAAFKSRALKRHESFNKLIKDYEITLQRFRHSDDQFKHAFEAVCVICQYKVELETPLYDVLIQDVLDKQ